MKLKNQKLQVSREQPRSNSLSGVCLCYCSIFFGFGFGVLFFLCCLAKVLKLECDFMGKIVDNRERVARFVFGISDEHNI